MKAISWFLNLFRKKKPEASSSPRRWYVIGIEDKHKLIIGPAFEEADEKKAAQIAYRRAHTYYAQVTIRTGRATFGHWKLEPAENVEPAQ